MRAKVHSENNCEFAISVAQQIKKEIRIPAFVGKPILSLSLASPIYEENPNKGTAAEPAVLRKGLFLKKSRIFYS